MYIRAIILLSLLLFSACQIAGPEDPNLLNERTFPSTLDLPILELEDIEQSEPGRFNITAFVVGMSACPEPGGPCHIPDGISIAGQRDAHFNSNHHYFIPLMQPRQFFVNQHYSLSVELYTEMVREDLVFKRLRLLGYDLN